MSERLLYRSDVRSEEKGRVTPVSGSTRRQAPSRSPLALAGLSDLERKKILVLLQGGYVDGGYVDDDGGNGNDDACCTGYTLSYTLFLTFIIVLIISLSS